MKKRILTWLLAVVMMLSFSTTALADTGDEDPEESAVAYSDQSSITITKYFRDGNGYYGYSQAEVFYLVQTSASGEDSSGNGISAVPSLVTLKNDSNESITKTLNNIEYPVVSKVTYDAGEAASELGGISSEEDENGLTEGQKYFVINLPDYEEPGTYTYKLSEVAGNTLGVTYYSGEITLVVQVYYNPSYDETSDPVSEKYIKIAYVSAAESTDNETEGTDNGDGDDSEDEDESSTSDKIDVIDNDYTTGSLTVKKVVTGNMGDTSDSNKFEFTVVFTVPEGSYWDGTVLVTYTDQETGGSYLETVTASSLVANPEYSNYAAGTNHNDYRGTVYDLVDTENIVIGEIKRLQVAAKTLDGNDVASYFDSDTKTTFYTTYTYTFYLSHGDAITFWNLPYGVTYRVYESNNNGYTVDYTLSVEDKENAEADLETFEEVDVSITGYPNGYLDGAIDLIKIENVDGEEVVYDNLTDHDELITYNEKIGDPDTGISLDSLPYILLLIAVGACAVVLISRKRMIGEN